MARITGFESGPCSSGILTFTIARLDCGHVGDVQTKPMLGRCMHCGGDAPEVELTPSRATICPACGGSAWTITFSPRDERAEDRISKIGDEVACTTCAAHADSIAWLQALDASTVHHARFRTWCGAGQYHLYRLDHTSPSNFSLIGSVPAIPAVDAILRQKRISPISPTEAA